MVRAADETKGKKMRRGGVDSGMHAMKRTLISGGVPVPVPVPAAAAAAAAAAVEAVLDSRLSSRLPSLISHAPLPLISFSFPHALSSLTQHHSLTHGIIRCLFLWARVTHPCTHAHSHSFSLFLTHPFSSSFLSHHHHLTTTTTATGDRLLWSDTNE